MMWLGIRLGGAQAYDESTWARLIDGSVVTAEQARKIREEEQPGLIDDAYTLGVLANRLFDDGTDPTRFSQERWEEEIRRRPFAMSPQRKAAVEIAKRSAGLQCQGLANRVAVKIGTEVANAVKPMGWPIEREVLADDRESVLVGDTGARERALAGIRDAVAQGVELGEGAKKVRSRILEHLNDGARDLDRIASTELQRAHDMGRAHDIAERYGADARVFKRTGKDACKSCHAAYDDESGQPRIFLLSELQANGDNFGKKQKEWLPTVGPLHPNCHCTLYRMPTGATFDDEGRIVLAH